MHKLNKKYEPKTRNSSHSKKCGKKNLYIRIKNKILENYKDHLLS
jgi:hypothetical protein